MFSRRFGAFLRNKHHVFRKIHAHFRSFLAAGFSNRFSLRVTTLLPLVILRSAECRQKDGQEVRRPGRKRTMSKVKYETSLEGRAQLYLNAMKVRWEQLHKVPGLFSYQLQKSPQSRKIPGYWGFYTELNAERSLKRRRPQTIENLNPTFKPLMFNFNKVDAREVIMTIDDAYGSPEVQMIINKSPITKYHTLICPEVKKNHVQRITREVLEFCITFMRSIDDKDMRMGYNSPGALASVNHLHFHLLQMPQDLYIDQVPLDELAGDYVYRLSRRAPTEGICIVFKDKDNDEQVAEKVDQLYKLAMWMCQNNMPHNLFITQDRRPGQNGNVQVFVFARSEYCVNKDLADFNVGFCELAGYIPLPDPDKMENLTELQVLFRIRTVTGDAPKALYEEITHIVEGREQSLWDQPLTI
ncbi:GDP-D-glucose phosphorylase 1 [Drosophila biarmipes]|uniref:GDP-D-glucose phosphorylase 1 n=1 Tax=Drosophila biarmipes TaxID=125945 RepID=UPI0007E66386|nr:GDP-D-glucose phosphorylase 1 [Drosophila biarmipes]